MTAPPEDVRRRVEGATVRGDVATDLERAVDRFDLEAVDCSTQCASGDPFEGRWRGVPVVDLLSGADPDATHLLVEAEDGFRACVPLSDAVRGILAVERLDRPGDGFPRLVVPSILGTRMVKDVARIETRQLSPEEDPADIERIDPERTSDGDARPEP